MAELPNFDNEPQGAASKPSIFLFRAPVPQFIADRLLPRITGEILPELHKKNPEYSVNPLFDKEGGMVAIDFFVPLDETAKKYLRSKIGRHLYLIQKEDNEASTAEFSHDPRKPISFTELLGTYRVPINRFFVPIFICIFFATLIGWMATFQAGLEINAAVYDPEESTTGGIILNALIPVVISAIFITAIWFIVKRYGMNAFKYIFGVLVLFYVWFGFTFVVDIVYIIAWNAMASTEISAWIFYILYYALYIGSAITLIVAGRRFFKNKLSTNQKNIIVLLFGIFLGAIIGISFPTWTMIAFAIILSIWDLIAVFKGPLGKIAEQIVQNRQDHQDLINEKVARGEIAPEQAEQIGGLGSLQDVDVTGKEFRALLGDIEIELGSGDLILYSALVAHAFINTGSWLITGLVILGVMSGAVLTLIMLITKKRVLPALPFSMAFGVLMFLLGSWIVTMI
jgi:presenilin-like A22 family membrane protease